MASIESGVDFDESKLRNGIKYSSFCQIGSGLFFWIYSLINMVNGIPFDSGIVVMVFAILSGIFGTLSSGGRTCCCCDAIKIANTHFILTVFAHGIISFVSLVGIVAYFVAREQYDMTIETLIYLVIFFLIWLTTGIVFARWSWKWRKCVVLRTNEK